MPERLPTFGESPYYNILVPWLRVSHEADGTLSPLTFTTTEIHTIGDRNPHQTDTDPDPNTMFWVRGDFTPGNGDAEGMSVSPAIRPIVSLNAIGVEVRPTFVEAASGTHALIAALEVEPEIIAGGANVTDYVGVLVQQLTANGTTARASGLKIVGPTGATTNYGIWQSGNNPNLLEGSLIFGTAASGVVGPSIFANNNLLNFAAGTSGYRWYNNQTDTERMRLTEGGLLLVGTTVTTGASSGYVVLANNKALSSVDAAGSDTIPLIDCNPSDVVRIAAAGGDILWGRALVALGAGGAATLGQVGGAGPATNAQNAWMRVIDSTGAAFWVPAWK